MKTEEFLRGNNLKIGQNLKRMFNYLIKIEYDGTNFAGWQSQKNGKSIKDSVEKALKKVLKKKIRITGAGRTDKGVHAYHNVQILN